MINVGRIVLSRNFAQSKGFVVVRTVGKWLSGRWVADPETTINMQGTITVAGENDLVQVPEGDRVTGMMCFFSTKPIYVTRAEDEEGLEIDGISDEIIWQGDRYRVSSVNPWQDFGYYKAFGVRMVSD